MKTIKKLDAVKMMRDIREPLSLELQDMSYAEQKKHIKDMLRPKKRRETPEIKQRRSATARQA
jgi:hypothetical protein